MKASVTELPFNSFLGIQIASEPSQILRLPSGEQYLNHLGTVNASTQLALAEASSGEFLLRHFGRSHDAVIRVYDETGNVIETHEHTGEFKEW